MSFSTQNPRTSHPSVVLALRLLAESAFLQLLDHSSTSQPPKQHSAFAHSRIAVATLPQQQQQQQHQALLCALLSLSSASVTTKATMGCFLSCLRGLCSREEHEGEASPLLSAGMHLPTRLYTQQNSRADFHSRSDAVFDGGLQVFHPPTLTAGSLGASADYIVRSLANIVELIELRP